jgi:hypothetical protein
VGAAIDNQPNKDFKPKAATITVLRQMNVGTKKNEGLKLEDDIVMTPSNSDSEQEKD